MRLVLLGPPGAGKGTQAQVLARRFQVPAISTGELFRAKVVQDTGLGRAVRAHLAAGQLVPDAVTNAMVAARLAESDVSAGFVLDGFPRTLEQAYQLDRMLWRAGVALDVALVLHVPDDAVIRRLAGRRTCRSCGTVWHIEFRPTRWPGRCDRCGHELYQREDDTVSAIHDRLSAYRVRTVPLLAFYAAGERLVDVAAAGVAEDVTAAILDALEPRGTGEHYPVADPLTNHSATAAFAGIRRSAV